MIRFLHNNTFLIKLPLIRTLAYCASGRLLPAYSRRFTIVNLGKISRKFYVCQGHFPYVNSYQYLRYPFKSNEIYIKMGCGWSVLS